MLAISPFPVLLATIARRAPGAEPRLPASVPSNVPPEVPARQHARPAPARIRARVPADRATAGGNGRRRTGTGPIEHTTVS